MKAMLLALAIVLASSPVLAQTSPLVPGQFGEPIASGSGCPTGVSSVLSPDASSLSILFDQFTVSAGGGVVRDRAAGRCRLKVPITVPAGSQVQLVKLDYRGANALAENTASRVESVFGFNLRLGKHELPISRKRRSKIFRGPLNEDFALTSSLRSPQWTPCGQSLTLIVDTSVTVVSADGSDGFTAIDSLDAVTAPVQMGFKWRRCRK